VIARGVTGSWFHNEHTQVAFDNPFRATDLAGTPSRGQSSLAPSNSFIGVNGLASVKLPGRSRATAYLSMGSLKDAGAALMPQTINAVNLPSLAALPRTTVDGEARTAAMNFTFLTRPSRYVDIDARYWLISRPGARVSSMAIEVGVLGKTAGFLPEEMALNAHVGLRVGMTLGLRGN